MKKAHDILKQYNLTEKDEAVDTGDIFGRVQPVLAIAEFYANIRPSCKLCPQPGILWFGRRVLIKRGKRFIPAKDA